MSLAVRQALATAASTVAGVEVSPYYRQVSEVGQGMVQLDRTDYPNPFGGLNTWKVNVRLPADQGDAEKWIDANAASLIEAVNPHMIVRSSYPQQLALPTGSTLLAFVIEGQRET